MEVRLLQFRNAFLPMNVTLLGMFMVVRLLQPSNVYSLICVTPSGMFMEVRLLHWYNIYIVIFQLFTIITIEKSFAFKKEDNKKRKINIFNFFYMLYEAYLKGKGFILPQKLP